MRALIARHLEWLAVTNYSATTVTVRTFYLAVFRRWCEERGITRPAEVTKPVLERYQRWLHHVRKRDGRPLSFQGQYTKLVAVRGLFRWLAKQNLILYNPASDLELPRLPKRLPKHILSAAEAEAVLNKVDLSDPLGLRDRAMLETFYSTGMRKAELENLHLFDVDAERGMVTIRQGKGQKDRVIPIGERAVAWIEKYLAEVRPSLVVPPDEGFLFLSSTGRHLPSDSRLSIRVREYIEAAGIGKSGGCHLFRHTMATLMLENGADIRFIQQMLGHSALSTTEIYTRVSIRKLKEIHTATHPAARLERRTNSVSRASDEASGGDHEHAREHAGDVVNEAQEPREKLLSSLAAEAIEEEHEEHPERDEK